MNYKGMMTRCLLWRAVDQAAEVVLEAVRLSPRKEACRSWGGNVTSAGAKVRKVGSGTHQ